VGSEGGQAKRKSQRTKRSECLEVLSPRQRQGFESPNPHLTLRQTRIRAHLDSPGADLSGPLRDPLGGRHGKRIGGPGERPEPQSGRGQNLIGERTESSGCRS
jgi:hypothetical protein